MGRLFSRAGIRATQCESERVTASKMDGRAGLCFRGCDYFVAWATLGHLGPLASDHLGPLWATLGRNRPEWATKTCLSAPGRRRSPVARGRGGTYNDPRDRTGG